MSEPNTPSNKWVPRKSTPRPPPDICIPLERDPRHLYTYQAPPYKRPRTCEELGICQGRYPACGQCDDDHPEDEPPSPGSFDHIWDWVVAVWWLFCIVLVTGGLAVYLWGLLEVASW